MEWGRGGGLNQCGFVCGMHGSLLGTFCCMRFCDPVVVSL